MQQKEEDVEEVLKYNGQPSYFLKMHNPLISVIVGMY